MTAADAATWRLLEADARADAVVLRGLRDLSFLDRETRAAAEREIARRTDAVSRSLPPEPPLHR